MKMSRDRPENHLQLPHHAVLSHLDVVLENLIHLTFLQEFHVLRLVSIGAGLRWMLSDVDLLEGFWLFHPRLGK